MFGRLLPRVLAIVFGCALGFAAGEIALARLVRTDADGNRTFRTRRLKPYRMPERHVQGLLESYRAGDSYLVYHAGLGWVPRPSHVSREGWRTNSAGMRTSDAGAEVAPRAAPGTLRIALFGDSFTECTTDFEHTWGHGLESGLRARGIPAEVLNLGTAGYGLDQAYLRWRVDGMRFAPQVVILGFQPDDVKRDLNLLRMLYVPGTGLPFTKPRFVFEGHRLALVNAPTSPPESLPALLAHFDRWPLARHERFYAAEDFRDRLWRRSRVLALAEAVLADAGGRGEATERGYFDPAGEGGALALAIVQAMATEVEGTGARFLLVHLPRQEDLLRLEQGRPLLYDRLLAELMQRHATIETSDRLLRLAGTRRLPTLFGSGAHYVAESNHAVAGAIADYLIAHR